MILRLIRWWVVLLAGMMLGAGLVLHGQLAMGRLIRDEVETVPSVYRAIGHATFFLQDAMTRSSLLLHEIPEEALKESDRMAWILLICGGLLAFAAPLLIRRHGGGGGGGGKSTGRPKPRSS